MSSQIRLFSVHRLVRDNTFSLSEMFCLNEVFLGKIQLRHKVSFLVGLYWLQRLIWDGTLRTCNNPRLPRTKLTWTILLFRPNKKSPDLGRPSTFNWGHQKKKKMFIFVHIRCNIKQTKHIYTCIFGLILGEKPYQCSQCEGKAFSTSHSLKNHLNRHVAKQENKQVWFVTSVFVTKMRQVFAPIPNIKMHIFSQITA